MLLPAILGPKFQNQYTKAMSCSTLDFAFIDASVLHVLLESIIESNNRFGNLSGAELVVNQFLTRALQLVQRGSELQGAPDVALSQWRTLFELSVCFRVWTQPVSLEGQGKVAQFLDMAQRFTDYGTIERVKVFNWEWTHVEREIELKYRQLPKHLQLQYEYDWLNPAFSEYELKRRQNKYHNTFRDVVHRSKELNWDLWNLLDDYVRSSTILHFNPTSMDVISVVDTDDVNRIFLVCLQSVLVDYLSLITNLYPDRDNTRALLNLAEEQLKQSKRA